MPVETLPPVPPGAIAKCAPQAAFWETPSIFGGGTVLQDGQTVYAFNVLRCGLPSGPGTLTVVKQVVGPPGAQMPATGFPFTVQCGTTTTFTLGADQSRTVGASGGSCTVSEVTSQSTVSLAACPSGQAMWLPPIFAPSASVTVPAGTAAGMVVTNTLQCTSGGSTGSSTGSAITTPPPPDRVTSEPCPDGAARMADGACPLHCENGMVPDKKNAACRCPDGMTLKNGKCEKKKSGGFFDHLDIGIGVGGGNGGGTSPPKGRK